MPGHRFAQSVLAAALPGVRGALEQEVLVGSVVFHRTPARARAMLADAGFDLTSASPSGVRLEVITDATHLEMDVALTHPVVVGTTSEGSRFDVVVDGAVRSPVIATEETVMHLDRFGGVRIEEAGPATVRFPLGETVKERRVQIWFPVVASFALLDVRIPDGATLLPSPQEAPVWLHHGSSISQAAEAGHALATWPVMVARSAHLSLINLGLGGHCHLDPFMARAIRDTEASVISLELGINIVNLASMRERTFIPAFHGFLDTIREGHPDTPILIISPIYCPVHESAPGPTIWTADGQPYTVPADPRTTAGALTLPRIRELLARQVDIRRREGDQNLTVLNGLDLFGPDDVEYLPDGLHPDVDGSALLATRLLAGAFNALSL